MYVCTHIPSQQKNIHPIKLSTLKYFKTSLSTGKLSSVKARSEAHGHGAPSTSESLFLMGGVGVLEKGLGSV